MIETNVAICNMALDLLGTDNITSLNEQYNDNAKRCLFWYDITRRTILKDLNASFAIKREAIASTGEVDIIENKTKFSMPDKCLKIIEVYDQNKEVIDFSEINIENEFILVDAEAPLYVRYVYDETNVLKYDDEFKELLAISLACNMSQKITQNTELTNYLEGLKKQKYIECSYKYGRDNRPKVITKSKFMRTKCGLVSQ